MDSAASLLQAVSFLCRDSDGRLLVRDISGTSRSCTLEPGLPEAAAQARDSGKPAQVRVVDDNGVASDMLLQPCCGTAVEGLLLDVSMIGTMQSRSLENLVNQIAHDVRNHSFTIGLQAEMGIRRAAGNVDLKGHFDAVLRQVDTLKGYLEKLLAFGRPVQVTVAALDPVAFVREQVQRFQFTWEPTSPPLSITVETVDLPAQVSWDARAVGAALAVLLDNAVRATPKVASVIVRVVGTENRVRIEVRDTGPGIPAQTLAKLATPMAVRRAGGAGLGLAIARKMAQAHGGTLTLDSGPEGTVARLDLPRNAA